MVVLRRIAVLMLLVAVMAGPSIATSVAVVKSDNTPISDDVRMVLEETRILFTEQGYTVLDAPTTVDYVVNTSFSVNKDTDANICGYLACGLFGAVKKSVTVNVESTITKGDAVIWSGAARKKVSGSDWFGTFESANKMKTKAVREALIMCYESFFKQYPPQRQ